MSQYISNKLTNKLKKLTNKPKIKRIKTGEKKLWKL
jgi:hypothetical protein